MYNRMCISEHADWPIRSISTAQVALGTAAKVLFADPPPHPTLLAMAEREPTMVETTRDLLSRLSLCCGDTLCNSVGAQARYLG